MTICILFPMLNHTKPLISAIVPAYNEEKYIDACVRSLVGQQTNVPHEVIVVDNNSTDATGALARKFANVRVVKEKRQGRAYARQKGADVARGAILAYTEADCVVPPNWISDIDAYFHTHPNAVGVSGIYALPSSPKLFQRILPSLFTIGIFFNRFIHGFDTFRGTNFAVKKSAMDQAGGFNQHAVPFDDVELGHRVRTFGHIESTPHLTLATSDRRFRGRYLTYLKEFFGTYIRIFVLKKKGYDDLYPPIR